MTQKIYFDESGFTGNNLLHPNQRHFAYASIATDDAEAKTWVDRLTRKYNIQGGELKGGRLVKFAKGRKAISEVLHEFDGRYKISISDKKFALAAKLHEYIFEPCYSEINSIFYDIGFHRFIANLLYVEFIARGAGAEELFIEFEQMMWRGLGDNNRTNILSSSSNSNSQLIEMVREFAQARTDDIKVELNSLANSASGKWILDLTDSALFTLLANWGEEHKVITAICDNSKPLEYNQDLFNAMIGNERRIASKLGVGEHPITFNLSGPIQFAASHESHGIQLADVIAAAAVFVFAGARESEATEWRPLIAKNGHYGSVVPDRDELELELRSTQLNTLVLQHLHHRATNGLSITEGMPEAIAYMKHALTLPSNPFSTLLK